MADSLEPVEAPQETENVVIMEYSPFANYILKAVTILLPEEDVVPPALASAMEDRSNQECIKKFMSDPQIQALYIQRSCSKGKLSWVTSPKIYNISLLPLAL